MSGTQKVERESSLNIAPKSPRRNSALECYLAGFIITSVGAPWIAIAIMIILFLGGSTNRMDAVLFGIIWGSIVWSCLAIVATQFVTINRAKPSVYRQLCYQFQVLVSKINLVNESLKRREEDPIKYAIVEVKQRCDLLQAALGEGCPVNDCNVRDWVGGFGYIRLWEQLHRTDETLTLLEPLETVLADAWNDQLRLDGSNIDNRQLLIEELQESIQRLETLKQERAKQATAEDSAKVFLQQAQIESSIRRTLQQVKRSINEFRDERWLGLVQVRNQLLKTVALTGCVCFSLVALAVLTEVASIHLAMGIAFFLVGAIVGLFNQLRLDASAETATEDYGLATARLVHTPLFSGLAALVGVLVIPLLSLLANGVAAKDSTPLPSLGDLFVPSPVSFLLAVVFGLSPTVLLNRLQKEAEQYKADLKSSESLSQEGGRGGRSSITRPSTFTVQPQSSVTVGLHPNGAPDAPIAPIIPSNN